MGGPIFKGPRILVADHAHQPACSLDHTVVGRVLCLRSSLAVAGERTENQPGIFCARCAVADPEFVRHAAAEKFQSPCRLFNPLHEGRLAFVMLEVWRERAFVGVLR